MSEEQVSEVDTQEEHDTKADMWAVVVMFCAAIAMAMHFVSGFTFDF